MASTLRAIAVSSRPQSTGSPLVFSGTEQIGAYTLPILEL